MQDISQFMSLFMIIIGIFTMYSAITGKGPAYNNDYPKSMKEDANKMLRTFCWIIGPVATVTGVFEYMGYQWAFWVNMGYILPVIIVYIVLFRRKFKDRLKKKF